MPPQRSCPLKFGSAVNTEGLLIEVPCIGRDCAWFCYDNCAILNIAREWCGSSLKKKKQKGARAA